jgi:hypothetical protein
MPPRNDGQTEPPPGLGTALLGPGTISPREKRYAEGEQLRSMDDPSHAFRSWVGERFQEGAPVRPCGWTGSVAVGNIVVIEQTDERLGIRARGRDLMEELSPWQPEAAGTGRPLSGRDHYIVAPLPFSPHRPMLSGRPPPQRTPPPASIPGRMSGTNGRPPGAVGTGAIFGYNVGSCQRERFTARERLLRPRSASRRGVHGRREERGEADGRA